MLPVKSFLFGAFIEYLSLDRGGARWRTATALLVSNALVIVGALFFHWPFGVVMFLYWAENLVIGALQVARMLLRALRYREWKEFFSTAPFFTFHFGLFAVGQGVFMAVLAGSTGSGDVLLDELAHALSPRSWGLSEFLEGLWPPFLFATLSHLYSFWKHSVRGGSQKTMWTLMFEPYGRVFVMQVTVVFGWWLVNAFTDRGLGPLILMMVAKTAFDFSAHFKQHAND